MLSIKNWIIITSNIILICLISCIKKNHEECLNHKKYVYYDIFEDDEKLPVGAYRISNNGECVYYKYDYSSGRRCIWHAEDVVELNYWKYLGKGIIDIGGYLYYYEGFSKDTILLRSINDQHILDRIIKSKNQSDSICKKIIG